MSVVRQLPKRLAKAVRRVLGTDIATRRRADNWFQQAGVAIQARGLFVGCPLQAFEMTSRDMLCVALIEGLRPGDTVLEVGCGCLRTGYQFIRYLQPGHYFGVEPNVAMLNAGRELVLGRLESEKQPRFNTSADFAFDSFGTPLDFVTAFSVWSHAAKPQIAAMLKAFSEVASPRGKFVASWIPPRPGLPDYQGSDWVGRSHQSAESGVIAHDLHWIEGEAARHGLRCRVFDAFTTLDQSWLIVERDS